MKKPLLRFMFTWIQFFIPIFIVAAVVMKMDLRLNRPYSFEEPSQSAWRFDMYTDSHGPAMLYLNHFGYWTLGVAIVSLVLSVVFLRQEKDLLADLGSSNKDD